jgi:hypothetical protein
LQLAFALSFSLEKTGNTRYVGIDANANEPTQPSYSVISFLVYSTAYEVLKTKISQDEVSCIKKLSSAARQRSSDKQREGHYTVGKASKDESAMSTPVIIELRATHSLSQTDCCLPC